MSTPTAGRADDEDALRPGVSVDLVGSDGAPLAPVVAGVGVPGDGVRS